MIRRVEDEYVMTTHCDDADEAMVCCDCLGWFPMQRIEAGRWQVKLKLPAGRHHFRYYVRRGRVTLWHDQDDLDVAADRPSPLPQTGRHRDRTES